MKRLSKKLLGLSVAMAIGFVAAECILRLVGFSHPSFYRTDPRYGTGLRPGAEGWYTKEGKAYVRINEHGMRDQSYPISKPAQTYRIALLGDSYAEAIQVPVEHTFWYIAEQQLRKCSYTAGINIEILNFGVSGYGTGQELLLLRHHVWQFEPDAILLAFLTGNDLSDNVRELKKINYQPYFHYQKGELVLDQSYLQSADYRLRQGNAGRILQIGLDHSRILQLANRARNQLRATARNPQASEQGLAPEIYQAPKREVWKQAWRVTEGLLALMHQEVRAQNASFFVVTLTNSIQVHPDEKLRNRERNRMGVTDLFYPDRRIQSIGATHGFPVLSLAPLLHAHVVHTHEYLHGFDDTLGQGHWNKAGHRQAGLRLAQWICSIWPTKDTL